jgi:hypothetical protein
MRHQPPAGQAVVRSRASPLRIRIHGGPVGEAYLKDYEDGRSAARSLGTCFGFHNREQLHESLNYRVPEEGRFDKSPRGASRFRSLRQVPARQDWAAAGLVPAEP